ncbi:MAG TPA: class I SAM-dependent methyltransferase [Acidimicrobiales bacterium]|jgi:SAM-dependent methyltransferase|nr:class I SAM-dependent methyltransferase [Acidimicrobiales bacterium]
MARSVRLFQEFRREQSEPERFYRFLAEDSVRQVGRYADLAGARVLDVGGGPGWFDDAFAAAGAIYCAVDADAGEVAARAGRRLAGATVAADGTALPFPSRTFDVCFSSNVLEHVERPWPFLDELVRATRPGGTIYCAFTNWFSPWGGHETSPWHWLGGDRAARRYERRFGRPPKNRYGVTLFPVHVGATLRWARRHPDVDLIDARPRYYPDWCRPIVAVPGMREVATWNLATVLRRRPS